MYATEILQKKVTPICGMEFAIVQSWLMPNTEYSFLYRVDRFIFCLEDMTLPVCL